MALVVRTRRMISNRHSPRIQIIQSRPRANGFGPTQCPNRFARVHWADEYFTHLRNRLVKTRIEGLELFPGSLKDFSSAVPDISTGIAAREQRFGQKRV